jgi:uncharacterized protein
MRVEETVMTAPASFLGPREVFELMQHRWLGDGTGMDADLLDENVVIEMPFALPGRPSRFEGRDVWLSFAEPQRAAFPVRFEAVRHVVIHDTSDPEVIVAEYELAGTLTTTGRRAAAPFIGVLRVRDGQIVHWREYQNMPAIADALGPAPEPA